MNTMLQERGGGSYYWFIKEPEEKIIGNINSLKDGFNTLKDIVIKRLQYNKERLRGKYDCLERIVDVLQASIVDLEQHDRRKNLILTWVPGNGSDNNLEKTTTAMWFDIDVQVTTNIIKACHRIEKSIKNSK